MRLLLKEGAAYVDAVAGTYTKPLNFTYKDVNQEYTCPFHIACYIVRVLFIKSKNIVA